MKITYYVYTKEGCPYCKRAKDLLTDKDLPYQEVLIGRDILLCDFKKEFPEVKSIPYIMKTTIDQQVIGGYAELIDHLNS